VGEGKPLVDRVSARDRDVVEGVDDLIAGAPGVTIDRRELALVGTDVGLAGRPQVSDRL